MSHWEHIVFVGCGGLGGPAALSLSSSCERITLIDGDKVELSNLHRQIHFSPQDIGAFKVDALRRKLLARGFAGVIETLPEFFDQRLATRLPKASLFIEGTDSPTCKFAVNDLCASHRVPVAIGGLSQYKAHVFTSSFGQSDPCYRCLFEEPVAAIATCATQGVLGPAATFIGATLANAAQRIGPNNSHSLLSWEDLRTEQTPRTRTLQPQAHCPNCQHYRLKEKHYGKNQNSHPLA